MKCIKCGCISDMNYCDDCVKLKLCWSCTHLRQTCWSTEKRAVIGKCRLTNQKVLGFDNACDKYEMSII